MRGAPGGYLPVATAAAPDNASSTSSSSSSGPNLLEVQRQERKERLKQYQLGVKPVVALTLLPPQPQVEETPVVETPVVEGREPTLGTSPLHQVLREATTEDIESWYVASFSLTRVLGRHLQHRLPNHPYPRPRPPP